MASLCARAVPTAIQQCRRLISYSAVHAMKIGDTAIEERLAGKERAEAIERAKGNTDPYHTQLVKREKKGTVDDPHVVPSVFDNRLVGCICHEDDTFISWMWLHEGHPRRCECGCWFKLKKVEPIGP